MKLKHVVAIALMNLGTTAFAESSFTARALRCTQEWLFSTNREEVTYYFDFFAPNDAVLYQTADDFVDGTNGLRSVPGNTAEGFQFVHRNSQAVTQETFAFSPMTDADLRMLNVWKLRRTLYVDERGASVQVAAGTCWPVDQSSNQAPVYAPLGGSRYGDGQGGHNGGTWDGGFGGVGGGITGPNGGS